MKRSGLIILVIVAAICVFGLLAVLFVPSISGSPEFVLGAIVSLSILTLSVAAYASRARGDVSALKDFKAESGRPHKRNVPTLAIALLALAGLTGTLLIVNQNNALRTRASQQSAHMAYQTAIMDSARYAGLAQLMRNLFDKIDHELLNNPERKLSDATIGRISALSYSYKPYHYITGDTLSEVRLSPERGQLLLALTKMNIDTSSLVKILLQTTFEGADLEGADLRGAYLKRADLRGANLRYANLERANLIRADLRAANMKGAILKNARIQDASLQSANLSWVNLNKSKLKGSQLDGVDLTSASLREADLSKTFMRWADLSGAFFNDAQVIDVWFVDTRAVRTNFSGTNLTDSHLIRVQLNEANMTDTDLTGAYVLESDWIEMIDAINVEGATEIEKQYKLKYAEDKDMQYRLQRQY